MERVGAIVLRLAAVEVRAAAAMAVEKALEKGCGDGGGEGGSGREGGGGNEQR